MSLLHQLGLRIWKIMVLRFLGGEGTHSGNFIQLDP
jgi:hypothetical protein